MKTYFNLSLVAALVGLAISGCTSKTSLTASTVTLQLPNYRASAGNSSQSLSPLSTLIPGRIMVNVTGSGISSPILYIWNAKSQTDVPPTTITLDVPSGPARLVQVLVALMDSASGTMSFEYGDALSDMASGDVAVGINAAPIAGSIGQGSISGQYIGAGSVKPTGTVSYQFAPAGGKPPMVLGTTEIFGGWFNGFAPQGAGFNYVFEDGSTLLANVSSAGSGNALLTNANAAMYITVPQTYQMWGGNSATSIIAGFFGAGVSTQKACFDPGTGSIPNLFTDTALSSPLYWSGATAPTAAQVGRVSGGLANTNVACTGGTVFNNIVNFNQSRLSNGKDSGLTGFKGPFQDTGTSQSQYLTAAYTTPNLVLSWKFVPGATSGVDGVEVFYNLNATSYTGRPPYEVDNNIMCASLTGFGFTSGGSVATPGTSLTISAAKYNSSTFAAIACPYRTLAGAKVYFTSAAQLQGGGGGAAPPPQYQIGLVALANNIYGSAYISNNSQDGNTCHPYNLQLQTMSGAPAPNATANVTVNIQSSGSFPFTFCPSADTACACALSTASFTIPSGANSVSIYVKSGPSVSSSSYASTTVSAMGLRMTTLDLASLSTSPLPSAANSIKITSTPNMAQGYCYPVNFDLEYSGTPTVNTSAVTVSPSTSNLSGSFHLAGDCTDAVITSATIPPYNHEVILYFSPSATTAGAIGNITMLSSPGLTPTNMSAINVGSTAVSSLSTSLAGSGSGCRQVAMNFKNSVGASVNPDNPSFSVSLSVTSGSPTVGALYTGADCITGPLGTSATVSFSSAGPPPPLYYNAPASYVSASGTVTNTAGYSCPALSW